MHYVSTLILKYTNISHADCQCQCCVRKAVRCIRFLGESGANMNEAEKTGETPLHLSAHLGVEEISLELLKQGASLDTK